MFSIERNQFCSEIVETRSTWNFSEYLSQLSYILQLPQKEYLQRNSLKFYIVFVMHEKLSETKGSYNVGCELLY